MKDVELSSYERMRSQPNLRALGRHLIFRCRRESIIDVYSMLLGGFLFLSPWLFTFVREPSRLDAWVVGMMLLAFSGAAALFFAEWEELANLALGLWLIVAPWILGFAHTTAMHVSIGIGLAVSYLALLELWWIHYRWDTDEDQSRYDGSS